jgi:hypothetical protein
VYVGKARIYVFVVIGGTGACAGLKLARGGTGQNFGRAGSKRTTIGTVGAAVVCPCGAGWNVGTILR